MPSPEKPRDLTVFVGPIRMATEDVDWLREQAKENERSVAAEIRLMVRERREAEAA